MNRRSFLLGSTALVAAPLLPAPPAITSIVVDPLPAKLVLDDFSTAVEALYRHMEFSNRRILMGVMSGLDTLMTPRAEMLP